MVGRRRNPIDSLRTRAWYAAVEAGGLRPQSLERLLDREHCRKEPEGWYQPNAFYKYRSGTRVPDDVGARSVITCADLEFPGTARVFRSSLWLAMQSQPVSRQQIEQWLDGAATPAGRAAWDKSGREEGRLELLGDGHIDSLGCQLLRIRVRRVDCGSAAPTAVWSSLHWIDRHLKQDKSFPLREELLERLEERVRALGSLRLPPPATPEVLKNAHYLLGGREMHGFA